MTDLPLDINSTRKLTGATTKKVPIDDLTTACYILFTRPEDESLANHHSPFVPEILAVEVPRTSLLFKNTSSQPMHPGVRAVQAASLHFSCTDSHLRCSADGTMNATGIEIPVDTTTTDVAFCPKPTYKLHVSIGIRSHTLTSIECLLNAGAGLNLINASFVHKKWTCHIKHTNLPRLRTPTKEPIQLYGAILLHLRVPDLLTRV